ncbi:hypothetical protein PAEPH01_0734 [Pancytospora epiphaga]|nr:hypothetical protein PAEPH01_0734 [Pancytospora epiphaga]
MNEVKRHSIVEEGTLCQLEDLYEMSTFHLRHSREEIAEYYFSNCSRKLIFEDGSILEVADVFLESKALSDSLSDELYALILTHKFISLSGLGFTLTLENIDEFILSVEGIGFIREDARLQMNPRIVSLLNDGLVSPYMFDIPSDAKLSLSRSTFGFLLKRGVDVTELMVYELKEGDIRIVAETLARNKKFRSKCVKYISEQGVMNNTTFLIALLLDIGSVGRGVDHISMYSIFCNVHNSLVYIPFKEFRSIGAMGRLEVYCCYLMGKRCYKEDLNDILEVFAEAEMMAENLEGSQDLFEPRQSNILKSSEKEFSNIELGSIKVQQSSFGNDSNSEKVLTETQSRLENVMCKILDHIYSTGADFGFQKYAFKLLLKLEMRPYFFRLFNKYTRELVCHNLRPNVHGKVYDALKLVISYLVSCCDLSLPEPFVPLCSLETINSDVFLSDPVADVRVLSIHKTVRCENVEEFVIPEELPFVDFTQYSWITEEQMTVLMEHYMKTYSAVELAPFYCKMKGGSKAIDAFFREAVDDMSDVQVRALLMCKLGVVLEKEMISKIDVNLIFDSSNYFYGLRQEVLYGSTVRPKNIEKYIKNLTYEEDIEIIQIVGRESVSRRFIGLYISHLFIKYELSFILEVLVFIIETYDEGIATKVLRSLIVQINELFLTDSNFDHIGLLCKKTMRFKGHGIAVLNERILSLMVACAEMAGKDICIGNIKT